MRGTKRLINDSTGGNHMVAQRPCHRTAQLFSKSTEKTRHNWPFEMHSSWVPSLDDDLDSLSMPLHLEHFDRTDGDLRCDGSKCVQCGEPFLQALDSIEGAPGRTC